MKAVIQRVSEAQVKVDGNVIGAIGHGLLVLLGIEDADTDEDIAVMFSPPLVREPVTKRLWTFICK